MVEKKKWSAEVTDHSDALELEEHIFEKNDPKEIAASLKHTAEKNTKRKAEPFRSAMSMLTFYINRAGKNLPAHRRQVLEDARRMNCATPMASQSRIEGGVSRCRRL